MGGNNSGWGDNLMDLALMWWASRGQNGSTPNFYNVPLTPEQKRWEDARWDLYQRGGSDQAKAVGAAGMQFLQGLQSGPSNFSFTSPAMQGQTFAGGFQMPKIDISRFPMPQPGSGNARPTPTGPGRSVYEGPGGRPTSDEIDVPFKLGGGSGARIKNRMAATGQESLYGESIYDMITDGYLPGPAGDERLFPTSGGPNRPNPGYDYGDGFKPGDKTPGFGGLSEDLKQRASAAWKDFTTKYPDWWKRGTDFALRFLGGALGGPGGALAGGALANVFRWLYGSGQVQTPQQGGVIPGSMNNGINNALGGNQ